MIIITDTREQKPLKFMKTGFIKDVVTEKLDVGDYSIKGLQHKIAIERKSPIDLFGTLGKGHERFKRELERAKDHEFFAIVIEASFMAVQNKFFPMSHKSQMQGPVILKQLMTITHRYGVHVYFCNNAVEAGALTRMLLQSYYKIHRGELSESERDSNLSQVKPG